jgi:anthranilate phosphoribosyltransferase
MRKKIGVIGSESADIAQALAPLAEVGESLSGANVVVLGGDGDLEEVRTCAPAAVVVVIGDAVSERCQEVYEATLFPRARIIGLTEPGRAASAVEAILLERDEEHGVVAMSDGGFGPRTVRLGRGGIRALL